MPIYEYQCTACGHQLDAMQKMSDAPLKDCPKCNQPTLSKLVSAAGFQLKGGGWYVTDYSKKGKSSQGAASGKEADSSGSSASGEGQSSNSDKSSSNDSGASSS